MSANSDLLAAYQAAELKILGGQAVQMGERSLRLADLEFVQAERRRLQLVVDAELAAASGRSPSRFSQANFGGGDCDGSFTR